VTGLAATGGAAPATGAAPASGPAAAGGAAAGGASPAAGAPPRIDPLGTALRTDPYPTYRQLRAAGPVCRAGPGIYAVTRYADVAALIRDERVDQEVPAQYRRQLPAPAQDAVDLRYIVSAVHPPLHTRIRRLLSRALNPSVIRRMRERIETTTDELIAAALDRGGFDAVTELAVPLQTMVACELVGVPVEDRAEVCQRAVELGRALILVPFVDPAVGDGSAQARWLRGYVTELMARRRRQRGDDLVSHLVDAADAAETAAETADAGDGLTDDEIADNVVFLFFAGFETSMHMVSGGLATLLRFPDQLARLRADRSLLPTAVEELLRFDPPIQWIGRTTAARLELGGRTIRPGRFLLLLLGSANRDERQFAEPDRLDIGRHPNRHVSFGSGIHHCLGVQLARAEGAAVLDRLVRRCAAVELAGEPQLRPHPNLRGHTRVPVAVRPA
jgi:cytochrome P450